MSATGGPSAVPAVLRLAWPVAASYLLNNAYRIIDQFWIQGLGPAAHAATGASLFVLIMSFAVAFLSAGGALSLVARATGAGDGPRLAQVVRYSLGLSLLLGLVTSSLLPLYLEPLVGWLGLGAEARAQALDYLGVLLLCSAVMYVVPTLDSIFIGMGKSSVPMVLNVVAIALNFALNPILIYGPEAERAMPGVWLAAPAAAAAQWLGIEGQGMAGAAWATVISRAAGAVLGLLTLQLSCGVRLWPGGRPQLARFAELMRIAAPASLSIALYAGVYWALLGLVLARLSPAAVAGLGLGFQVFEGVTYPCFLGVGLAAASLVGQALGGRDPERALEVVRSARLVGRAVGIGAGLAFLCLGRPVGEWFTGDPEVLSELMGYVWVLAFAQYFVSVEAVNERVLLGAGHTRPIPWIAGGGNLVRVPLAYLTAILWGGGPEAVWWSISATTVLKAFLLWREVERRHWLARLGS
jgi:putative MATE family efflux protein